ncbi:MAG TPA: hypothetical protein VF787_29440 [Thermoanaerobaculia bacterium]
MTRRFLLFLLLALCPFAMAADYTVTHFAGPDSNPGDFDGSGQAARFAYPVSIASDAAGNIYVGDSTLHLVRKITPAGEVTTLAGLAFAFGADDARGASARFSQFSPRHLAATADGTVYVSEWGESSAIRRISPDGVVTTLYRDPPYAWNPDALAVDAAGNVWVSGDNAIWKITPAGFRTLVAGQPHSSGYVDGNGTDARIGEVYGLAFNPVGDLLFTDKFSQKLRKLAKNGAVTTIATMSGYPNGVAVDPAGNAYVATHDGRVYKVTPAGSVMTFSGSSEGYADGPWNVARFFSPWGITRTPNGALYVADSFNRAIRRIATDGSVSTFAGAGSAHESIDGNLAEARFIAPQQMVFDRAGNSFVVQHTSIRKITAEGQVSLFAGIPNAFAESDGTGTAARFWELKGLTIDANDNLYVTDKTTIRKITPDAVVTTFAGTTGTFGDTDANGIDARFRNPWGIIMGPDGTLYVSDASSAVIRKITPSGDVTTIAGSPGEHGSADGVGSNARFRGPEGMTFDAGGALIIADRANYTIRKLTLSDLAVTTIAGVDGIPGEEDGPALSAYFWNPSALATAADGTIFISGPGSIRTLSNGTVGTLGFPDTIRIPWIAQPSGLTMHDGALYIVDSHAANIKVARVAGVEDRATASPSFVALNAVVQLSTDVNSATSWEWRVIRRPANSTAQLSATNVRNPTFAPDVADLYKFLLRAEGPNGVRYSTVYVQAAGGCEPCAYAIASIFGRTEESYCTTGSGGTASVAVSGGGDVTYQWGWRSTPDGANTPIAGATLASYQIQAADFGGATGTAYLVVTVTPSCGNALVSNPITLDFSPATIAAPTITASSDTIFGGMEYTATVDVDPSLNVVWSIFGGTILSGSSTHTVSFRADATGYVALSAHVVNDCASAEKILAITERPAGSTLLYLVTPCRLYDSRNVGGALPSAWERSIDATTAGCGIPSDAKAIAVNVTAVNPAGSGFLALFGESWSGTSSLNYRTGKTRASNGIVPLSPSGAFTVYNVGSPTNFIVDVSGYFK